MSDQDKEPRPDENRNFAARWYLNGFPKSGLHLLVQMMKPFVKFMPSGQLHVRPWLGTFCHHSWSDEWQYVPLMLYQMTRLQIGHYFKGHCGHKPEIEEFLWYAGVAHVFVYRDLRDVAVSQAYHILNADDERFKHPDKGRYARLGGFDQVLSACIVGLDEFPGVVARWEYYEPWLRVPWVLHMRFEEMRSDPQGSARRLLQYGFGRIAALFGINLNVDPMSLEHVIGLMVASANRTEESPTYRKGQVGGWHEHFTVEHKRQFKRADRNNWITRLGYETDSGW